MRLLLAAIAGVSSLSCDTDVRVVVGAKAFTEGYLFGHMIALVLAEAGYRVDEQYGLASAAMRGALETGQVDLYVEYTGTAFAVYAHGTDRDVMTDSAMVLAAVRRYDSVEHDLIWLRPLAFENTYALVAQRTRATALGVKNLSELAAALNEGKDVRLAVDAEFFERPDGLKALAAEYGMPLHNVRKMDAGLIYEGVRSGAIDVGMGYSTDGRIDAFNLVVLADDRHFFPAYHPAIVVRHDVLRRHPGLPSAVECLHRLLDAPTMRRLNSLVDIHHHDPRRVARDFLMEKGVLRRR